MFLQWPEPRLAQLVLRPAEVAHFGPPVSFRMAYLTPRIAVSMLGAWTMSFASASPYPRRTTRPDGSQSLPLRAITTGLRADLSVRLAAIEARLPAGTAGLSSMDYHAELTMLVWRVRDEVTADGRRDAAAPP